ncbi:NAD(P)-dependent oxidoreductase [Allosalinactinospora lopnorensis]|uniref:NAD(P)-dependent oxidoreductase n=1 Tax=Allosalinactinospora lopnorensis TaxID=1352348 RepID=UPI00191BFF85|nr:NAD(P)H-binding protein [Allosalinactinospora lopnorensis]
MKLAILGATGRTGRHVVEQTLERGHTVTALVRDPAKLDGTADPRLRIVRTDVMDPEALAAEFSGHEAVVSAIGPPGNVPTTVCTDSAGSIVRAMERAGVSRLVVVSASGPHTDGDGLLVRAW